VTDRPAPHGPDSRDGSVYEMPTGLELAVRVALATDRPLLLSGEPGSGKSSLAPYVARRRDLRYYEHVVTSRTQATDLLWTFDSVRRLADAQLHRGSLHDAEYLQPGVLWWSLAPESALSRGGALRADQRRDPLVRFSQAQRTQGAVVLVDEIDKADPDVPNSLLVPLGSQQFTIAETGSTVRREPGVETHLTIITTNGERELPQAFLRRCVTFELPPPNLESLLRIAAKHLGQARPVNGHGHPTEGPARPAAGRRRELIDDDVTPVSLPEHTDQAGWQEEPDPYEWELDDETLELAMELAEDLLNLRQQYAKYRERMPSTAEYLDALRACRALGVRPGNNPQWERVRGLTLAKAAPGRLG